MFLFNNARRAIASIVITQAQSTVYSYPPWKSAKFVLIKGSAAVQIKGRARVRILSRSCIHIYTHARAPTDIYIYIYVCVCVCVCACVRARVPWKRLVIDLLELLRL
jgi:hypothetical protein